MPEPTSPNLDDPLGVNEDAAGIGHNNPPEPLPYDAKQLADLNTTARKFVAVSDEWLKVDVSNETLAGQLSDQIDGLRKLHATIEAARKDAKAPHLERGAAVDTAFNAIKTLVQKSAVNLKPILAGYIQKKEDAAEALRLKNQEAARQAEAAARLAEMEAENSQSIDKQIEADQAKEAAQVAAKVAAKPISTAVKSASGAGRTMSSRKRRYCTIDNVRHLFLHYQDRSEVHELLTRLANAEANAAGFVDGGKIPGTTIETKNTVA